MEELDELEAQRASDADSTATRGTTTIPVFVLDSILPRQAMELNVFEPRYRTTPFNNHVLLDAHLLHLLELRHRTALVIRC